MATSLPYALSIADITPYLIPPRSPNWRNMIVARRDRYLVVVCDVASESLSTTTLHPQCWLFHYPCELRCLSLSQIYLKQTPEALLLRHMPHQLNSTAMASASSSVTWTRDTDDSPTVVFDSVWESLTCFLRVRLFQLGANSQVFRRLDYLLVTKSKQYPLTTGRQKLLGLFSYTTSIIILIQRRKPFCTIWCHFFRLAVEWIMDDLRRPCEGEV